MPKAMQEYHRSFQIVEAPGLLPGKRNFGRYIGATARDAARKAIKQVYLQSGSDASHALVCLRETTRQRRTQGASSPGGVVVGEAVVGEAVVGEGGASASEYLYFVGQRQPWKRGFGAEEGESDGEQQQGRYHAKYEYRARQISKEDYNQYVAQLVRVVRATQSSSRRTTRTSPSRAASASGAASVSRAASASRAASVALPTRDRGL